MSRSNGDERRRNVLNFNHSGCLLASFARLFGLGVKRRNGVFFVPQVKLSTRSRMAQILYNFCVPFRVQVHTNIYIIQFPIILYFYRCRYVDCSINHDNFRDRKC